MTKGSVKIEVEKNASNVLEAAASGASDGMQLALNVAAMLLAFLALIAMFNAILSGVGGLFGYDELSLQLLLGWALSPVAFLAGVPWSEAQQVGALLGTKIVANEFVAYSDMARMIAENVIQDPKSITIATFALCGFANFSSIAIQIGGIAPMAPERRKDLAALGLRAVLGGMLATLLTGTIAGILL